MAHPEILLLPILMFADYLLTVLGAKWREVKYGEHFKTEHYELNPIWQAQISRKQWFNPRHIILVTLICGALGGLIELRDVSNALAEGILGCLFVAFGTIIGRHLSNLLVFQRFAHAPTEISGQVTMAHSLVLAISTYQYLVVVVPLGIIATMSPTPYVVGGLGGSVLVLVIHWTWIYRYRKKLSKHGAAERA